MNGGVIQDNKANPGGNSSGGGVYVANGSFTMTNNAQILNNKASNGGGVSRWYLRKCRFEPNEIVSRQELL